jgi:hypothetical protein
MRMPCPEKPLISGIGRNVGKVSSPVLIDKIKYLTPCGAGEWQSKKKGYDKKNDKMAESFYHKKSVSLLLKIALLPERVNRPGINLTMVLSDYIIDVI